MSRDLATALIAVLACSPLLALMAWAILTAVRETRAADAAWARRVRAARIAQLEYELGLTEELPGFCYDPDIVGEIASPW